MEAGHDDEIKLRREDDYWVAFGPGNEALTCGNDSSQVARRAQEILKEREEKTKASVGNKAKTKASVGNKEIAPTTPNYENSEIAFLAEKNQIDIGGN